MPTAERVCLCRPVPRLQELLTDTQVLVVMLAAGSHNRVLQTQRPGLARQPQRENRGAG